MRADERLDTLDYQDLRIYQKKDAFRFGTDSVLLADFASPKAGDIVADLGTGTGILPILMASRQPKAVFDAIEIQGPMAEMAQRSVIMNGLDQRIRIHELDFRKSARLLGHGKYSLVVCNPPYGKAGSTLVSEADTKRVARHEGDCTIEDVTCAAAALLKTGGRFACVFPAQRMLELMWAMRVSRLEPKRIRTIHQRAGIAPKLILLDSVKMGGSQLHWMPPLILEKEDGSPSEEWRRIYRIES